LLLKLARFVFASIADDLFLFRGILQYEAPLHSGRETRAATSAQLRLLYLSNHLVRRHRIKHLLDRFIAAVPGIDFQRSRVLEMNSPELKWFTSDGANKHDLLSVSSC